MPRRAQQRPLADDGAAHVFTYLGPAKAFQVAEGADPIAPGETVSLTGRQVRALVKTGHRFSADSQVGNATLDAAREAQRVERQRLELEARINQQAKSGD
jgi:hypothetical protein